MSPISVVLGYLYIITQVSQAMPSYRPPTNADVNTIVESCSALVLETLVNRDPTISNDFRFDMRNEGKKEELFSLLTNRAMNQLSEGYFSRTYLKNDNDSLDRLTQENDLLEEYNTAFQRCLESYTANVGNSGKIYSDDGNIMSGLQNSKMTSRNFADVFKTVDAVETPTKRGKALTLNPTGWRKRRSDPRDNERLQQFMQNMHELLEKRQKLQFNPTGW